MLGRLTVERVGAWCAILVLPLFALGGVLLSTSGAGDLIPGTGAAVREWLTAVGENPGSYAAGGWVLILMGYVAMVALISFYFVLREAGPVLILAPVLGAAALLLVQVSHLIPIGMAYELAPAYSTGGLVERLTIGNTADTLAAISLVINAAGNAVGWGVAVPLYAWAILTTRALPRWLGWLGLLVAVLAGWLGLLAPVSDLLGTISTIGFIGFFVFMFCMGIAILLRTSRRRQQRVAVTTSVPT